MTRICVSSRALARRRILIVDAHPLVRRGLVALIDAEPDLVVGAQAASRREAIEAIAATRPDLAIVDLSLRGAPGLLRQVCANGIGPPVLVLTVHETALHVRRAFAAGAVGYVTKRAAGRELCEPRARRAFVLARPGWLTARDAPRHAHFARHGGFP